MKGDKTLKKILQKDKLVEEDKKNYENALEIGKHVKAKFNSNWEIAKIIEIRPNKEFEENPHKKQPSRYSQLDHNEANPANLEQVESVLLRIKKRLASKGTKGFLAF